MLIIRIVEACGCLPKIWKFLPDFRKRLPREQAVGARRLSSIPLLLKNLDA